MAVDRDPTGTPPSPLLREAEARSAIDEDHPPVRTDDVEACRPEAKAEVRRPAADRRGSDVGKPIEGREEGDDLVQAPIERVLPLGPAGRDQPVPEWLGVR